MFYRKDVALMAVAGLLASSGYAMAENKSGLSLDPTVLTAQDAPEATIMSLLGKAGMDKPLADAGLRIYGWVETGYTYNHRQPTSEEATIFYGGFPPGPIQPGPFTHQRSNHMMLNQVVLRFERMVDTTKFDVGGLIEVMYGSDAARIHSAGLGYNGSDITDDNNPNDPDAVNNSHPINHFDIVQAYANINLPVGNGLQVMVGKWVGLLGYETIDPRGNPFYSHSWAFSAVPGTMTGILGSYAINESLAMKLGISRGWDMATEDTNGAIDVTGQVSYIINKQMTVLLNYSVGPENAGDNGHYRTAINPIFYWQVTEALKIGVEGLYVYDGGLNQGTTGSTHSYGDVWGAVLYVGYKVNDMFTINGRFEKYHSYSDGLGAQGVASGYVSSGAPVPTLNVYSSTLGVTIVPMPKDPWLKGISLRPEIRYDFSEDHIFPANGSAYKDQLTFGCDIIVTF
jgi:hypothetical protein